MGFLRLGQFVVRRRMVIVVAAVVFLVVVGSLGGGVADRLSDGGFEDPAADSHRAETLLEERFDAGAPNVVVLVRVVEGTVDDADVADIGTAVSDELARVEGMHDVVSYWSLGSPPALRADDASSALVLGRLVGDEDELGERVGVIAEELSRSDEVVVVGVGGLQEAFREMGETIETDLARAELIAFPLTLLLLVLVFRSVVAALLPLGVGAFAIAGSLGVLHLLSGWTLVSIYALNITTALGLGLAIDYSLFVVSRYREEREAGHDATPAVVRTVATAGRAVAVSGLTVALSLAALLVFPLAFLRSFAYAGIPVVGLAVLGAVGVLPAVLALLGDRVDAGRLPRWRERPAGSGWERLARAVMRRPLPIVVGATVLLGVLGLPFLRIAFGLPDDRVLPAEAPVRVVNDHIRAHYDANETGALAVVLPETAGDDPAVDGYATRLSALEGVARVDSAAGSHIGGTRVLAEAPAAERFRARLGTATWLSVVPEVEPLSAAGEELVAEVRAVPAPGPVVVGGTSAMLVDLKDSIFERLPLAVGLVALTTFVLLLFTFASVMVPLKALVLNTLSLAATFGAMVWVFQDGNLAGSLAFTPTGFLDTTVPVLMFCIAFGLSMDYEVFLLSRIREEVDRGADNETAVARGLARSGRIITAAAVLISVVFLSFATSDVSVIKLFGLGLTLAVVTDATVVRALLVPALMKLAGGANWWAPRRVRTVSERLGLSEAAGEQAVLDIRATVGPTPGPVDGDRPRPLAGTGGRP